MIIATRKKGSWTSKRNGKVFSVRAKKPSWYVKNRSKVYPQKKVIYVYAKKKWNIVKKDAKGKITMFKSVDTPREAAKVASDWKKRMGPDYKIVIPEDVAMELEKEMM